MIIVTFLSSLSIGLLVKATINRPIYSSNLLEVKADYWNAKEFTIIYRLTIYFVFLLLHNT